MLICEYGHAYFSKDTKSMRDDLQKKIDQSIKLIRSTCEKRRKRQKRKKTKKKKTKKTNKT